MSLPLFSSFVTMGMVVIILFLQFQNAWRYGLGNGVGKMRMVLIGSVVATGIHIYIHWAENMFFLSLAILLFGIVYIKGK